MRFNLNAPGKALIILCLLTIALSKTPELSLILFCFSIFLFFFSASVLINQTVSLSYRIPADIFEWAASRNIVFFFIFLRFCFFRLPHQIYRLLNLLLTTKLNVSSLYLKCQERYFFKILHSLQMKNNLRKFNQFMSYKYLRIS